MTPAAGLHVPLQDKRSALTWLWAELGAHTLHVDVAAVMLEELPTVWRGQAMSPHVKYVVLPSQPNESER